MLLPRVSLRFALGYVLLPFQGVPFNRKVRFFLRTKLMA